MKNTFFLTEIARSMLIAGMVLGITGAVYAQSGAGGAGGAGGVGGEGGGGGAAAAVGGSAIGAGAAAGQGGSETSGMNKASGLGQDSPMREPGVPVPGRSPKTGAGAAVAPDIPPGKKSTSRAVPRMEGAGSMGGESTGMEAGSSQEQGASGSPSVPRY